MKLLIDTNIFIPLEPGSPSDLSDNSALAARLSQLAMSAHCELWVHPAQKIDLAQDKSLPRRSVREKLFQKYPELPLTVPAPPRNRTNDWVDGLLIEALEMWAVDGVVTEDRNLCRKAALSVGTDRVFSLADAVSTLESLVDTTVRPPPAVEAVKAFELNAEDPIWASFRTQYPRFDTWLEKCKREHRQSWIIRGEPRDELAGVAIVNQETKEPRGEKTLKICSLKVSERYSGKRYGELLLKAIFGHAGENGYDSLFVTVFPDHQELIALLMDFGFVVEDHSRGTGELILSKQLHLGLATEATPDPLAYHLSFGPFALDVLGSSTYIVPIQPHFHGMLFPEQERQMSLLAGQDAHGNTIKKAYLCGSPVSSIEPGSTLLFYRSQDRQAVCCVGVAERTLRSADPAELCGFVLPRTVYTQADIEAKCRSGPVLAIVFRQCLLSVGSGIGLDEFTAAGVLRGAPQTIVRIKEEHREWIAQRLEKQS